ncbi:MAG: ATP phosphoribosyltransferase [Gammaproteobacteria bacterium]|nr:ATP phosphoribosyltransferase [Gammaproteobacteria bacterium]
METKILLALSKGRLLQEELDLLGQINIYPIEDPLRSRKLVFETNRKELSVIVLRGSDVATYVQYGIADLGMVGKDILLEHESDSYYEPLDLGIGKCRLMVAGLKNETESSGRLRIATKFTNTSRRYFAAKGQQVDIIKLYGAMELAPVMGLAHRIVDIVQTGATLTANGLIPLEEITRISTKLIVNESSYKTKFTAMKLFIDDLGSLA